MNTLSKEMILEAAQKVKNGTITRVTYKTEVPLKAAYKKLGYKVVKVVETSGRLGVDYNKISTVIARKAEESAKEAIQRAYNYEWVIDNKVKHNTATNKDYLVLTSLPNGHHTKSKYIVMCGDIQGTFTSEEFMSSDAKEYVLNSYWNKGASPEVKTISFENIVHLNCVGERVSF